MNIYAQENTPPSMDLLEFIGEGVKVDNEIIDSMRLKTIDEATGPQQDPSAHDSRGQTQPQPQQRQAGHD